MELLEVGVEEVMNMASFKVRFHCIFLGQREAN